MEFHGIHQANYLDAFKGLSDPCPLVIDNVVNKIFRVFNNRVLQQADYLENFKRLSDPSPLVNEIVQVMENFFSVAIVFTGWNGIGKERILKYVAKRAMEAKSFDIVIWMIEKRNASSIRKFQMRVAEQLGVAFNKIDDSDDEKEDEGTADENVSGRIAACLEHKKFVLVHNGNWELIDLKKMGIPVSRGADYAMVLVVSSEDRKHHEVVSMENLSDQEVWDLVYEECIDIASCPSLRIGGITPNDVMACIICMNFSPYPTQYLSFMLRFWFAEGFIGGANLDLKTSFGFGQVMLEELYDHCIIDKCQGKLGSNVKTVMVRMIESNGYNLRFLTVTGAFGYDIVDANRKISVKYVRSLSPQVLFQLSTIIFLGLIMELPEDIFVNMTNVTTIDLSKTWIKSFPPSMLCLTNLKFLNLTYCKVLEPHQLNSIRYFKKIELLDLSETLFKEFPDNTFEGLDSLRLLDLSECSELFSLPSSIFSLINLEHLYLRSCRNLTSLPSSIQGLEKLQVLQMTGTKLIEIPQHFFKSMYSLIELDLSSNLQLTSIHTSSFTNILPNLQILNLSSVPVSQLSLKNRSSLETITLSNKNLEKLDLSNTNLKKFPIIQGDQNLIPLKQLELLNTKHLITVDWKDIKWLPQEVNWAQCGDGTTSHMYIQPFQRSKDGNRDGVFISIGNANIFRTLTSSSTLWAKSMSRFVVYVCPCKEQGKGKTQTPRRAILCYDDIFSTIKRSIPSYERCLEMERVNKLPKGISGILSHAQFFILHDEKIIMRLSDLGIENMGALRECWLERCHAMQAVFSVGAKAQNQPMLKCLEKIQISNLMKLTHMCDSGRKLEHRSFGQLKHIQIEHCPQLVNVFSSSVCLKSLEVLEIKFCARLEEIFSGKGNEEDSLPQLKTLCLLELPALKNIIHNVWLESLEKAKIKGCPRLRELPLRSDSNIQNNKQKDPRIVVKCELKWWEQLQWKDENVKQQISFNDWKPFQIPKQG
ncbi:hypothetical protein FRX31_020899 [Thalictrum thalictroides]|uniref:NB-ARC domain-containing protein n=1 Tax=Thalictrum thalictroides TaxID=46969 RepID=A0A7J6VWM9_THATH|nr:hypothetical protein FRX31_020899 [Thalictrum thalictroides]